MALSKAQKRQRDKIIKYWQQREDEALKHYIRDEREYDKRIDEIYRDMLDNTQKEIDAFYRKYAKSEKISIAEAKKRVSKIDMEEYERKAKKYVEAAARDRKRLGKTNYRGYYFSSKANDEMKLYNLTMKVNRLEMLKANIGLELVKGHAELETFMQDILEGRTNDEIERLAGIMGQSIRLNKNGVHALVNASFHNAEYSDRIWQHHDIMKADLAKLLQSGMIQGKSSRELSRELRKYFVGDTKNKSKGAAYSAMRLMRTEMSRVQTEAHRLSFEKCGYKQYIVMPHGDCCDLCRPFMDEVYDVADMKPGDNAPPFHPLCRCTIAAYSDEAEYEQWLDYLSNGGTTESWQQMKNGGTSKKTEKNSSKTIENFGNGGIIKEKDIIVHKSVGAKTKNYDIKLPNGEIVQLTEGTRVTKIQTIAGKGRNRKIDEIDILINNFGGSESEWQKKKGFGYVDYEGESYKAELHWYEEPTAGRHKWKVKPDANGNWFIEDE